MRPDYFTNGVKLLVSFERFDDEDDEASVDLLHTTNQRASEETSDVISKMYRFHFVERDKPKSVEIAFVAGQRKSVGRTKENDIFINDASVSKLHASLALNREGRLLVADTGSTNGTFINGRRIAYGKAEAVADTDALTFGTVDVKIEHLQNRESTAVQLNGQAPTVAIGDFEFSSRHSGEIGQEPVQPSPTEDQMGLSFHNEAVSEK